MRCLSVSIDIVNAINAKDTIRLYRKGENMEKYIFNQNCDTIWKIEDCTPIQRVSNTIYGVGYPVEDDFTQGEEDRPNRGLKKHLIELGNYDSEDRAIWVMILLVRWLNNFEGDPVFVMPEYKHDTNLIEELGGVDE